MRVGMLGISYKSSDLQLRELVAKACARRIKGDTQRLLPVSCVLLSTCNRTEIYFSTCNLPEAHSEILAVLREEIKVPFEHNLYSYFGLDCFAHLATVTAGLDSVIVAESEIQRQVKLAYESTLLYQSLPSCLHFMFQKCLKIGKDFRTQFPLPSHQSSLEWSILHLGEWIFPELNKKRILFIGNSEINRKILSYLHHKGYRNMTLCTHSVFSAQESDLHKLAEIVEWKALASWTTFDLVICGTNQHDYLLHPEEVKGENLHLIFDLSMPRTVDPRIAHNPTVTLFNIDELNQLIHKREKSHQKEIEKARDLIRARAERQIELFNLRHPVSSCEVVLA